MAADLAFDHYGDGPPLIILHGLFGSRQNWVGIGRKLMRSRTVYAVDLRNHGQSPWLSEMNFAAMIGDVISFMDAQSIESSEIIGHSMGGKTAAGLALLHGDRVSALIAVDIAPVDYASNFLDYIRAMQNIDLDRVTRRAEASQQLESVVPDLGIRNFLLQNLVRDGGRFDWRLNLAALAASVPEITGFPDPLLDRTFAGPTLFLGGGMSDYLRPEHEPIIHRMFPNAEIAHVPGAGHWVHAEEPGRFVAAVEEFLRIPATPSA
ncbi:MAG: alpha/beta fold hydrolase [Alphaproteobacteria bacterium]|nr:alpha/beta fold hydrolase [Alphaproteobacteria bacterium]